MKARCKNCKYSIKTKAGDMLCSMLKRPINRDFCCCEYRKKLSISISNIIALCIALVGLVLSMYKLLT